MNLFNQSRFLVVGIGVLALVVPARASDGPRVKTDRGTVEGKISPDAQVQEFLGIPYAAPPVGSLRWKPPQAVAEWRGVRQATSFGARCMQQTNGAAFHDPGPSEDCLTLNVWAPAKIGRTKLPVMVWIYGGGFNAGGTSLPYYDGEHLTHRGVLVVSMNYRLGIFGFFALPELVAESSQHAAGNYGLMDQTAALQWVQRNIAAFGGDPGNVTLFGQSAGSFAVSEQMASPLSRGLFIRAIGESGAQFASTFAPGPSLKEAESWDEGFAQAAFGSSSLTRLRAISAGDLLKAATTRRNFNFSPDIDGYFLPESISAIYAEGKQAHVPLLAGWNQDEETKKQLESLEDATVASLRTMAEKQFGTRADEFLKVYAASNNQEAVRAEADFIGDGRIAYSTWAWLEAQVKTGEAPVYRYFFSTDSSSGHHPIAAIRPFHASEIQYVFDNLNWKGKGKAQLRPEDYRLSELMETYWTNFAKTGDPNGPGLPRWPVYHAADGWQVMHLNLDPASEPDQHRDRYLFLQSTSLVRSRENR